VIVHSDPKSHPTECGGKLRPAVIHPLKRSSVGMVWDSRPSRFVAKTFAPSHCSSPLGRSGRGLGLTLSPHPSPMRMILGPCRPCSCIWGVHAGSSLCCPCCYSEGRNPLDQLSWWTTWATEQGLMAQPSCGGVPAMQMKNNRDTEDKWSLSAVTA
jgi:hypothetical protein